MKKIPCIFPIRTLAFVLVIVIAFGAGIWWHTSRDRQSDISVRNASAIDIRTLVQMCTAEIYEDVPVKYRIGTKHLVARQLQLGTVSFDLEGLDAVDMSADSLTVVLPAEIVEIHESTAPNAYEVYDTWNDELFGSNNLTVREENKIKERAGRDAVRRQYVNGTVARARREAAVSLKSYMEMLYRKPVRVVDPSPSGVHYKKYVGKL